MGKAIGIDLGTTNCCVSVLEGGSVQIVPNKEGGRTTPSVVGFTDKGERLVGQIAKRQAVTNAANTVYAVKRLIGRKYISPEVQRMKETSAFEIVDSPNGDARIRVQGRSYSPPELSGIVLQRLKPQPRISWVSLLPTPSSPCRLILTTHSARLRRTQAK